MMDDSGKELPPERAPCRYWALPKCQFREQLMRLHSAPSCLICYLGRTNLRPSTVQTDIGWVWDPKYRYHLDLTNAMPIRAKPPCLRPEEEA